MTTRSMKRSISWSRSVSSSSAAREPRDSARRQTSMRNNMGVRLRVMICILVAVIVGAACSSTSSVDVDPEVESAESTESSVDDADDGAESASEPAESEPVDSGDNAAPIDPAWADTGLRDGDVEEILEDCPDVTPAAQVDLWPDLDGALSSSLEETLRSSTAPLLQVNPTSCRLMERTDVLVDTADVGATAAQGFMHTDPDLRWDVYVFPESVEDGRDRLIAAVNDATPEGSFVNVLRIASQIFVATSAPEEFDFRSDGDRIINHYGSYFGDE